MPPLRFGLGLCLALAAVAARSTSARAEMPTHTDGQTEGDEASIVLVGAAARDPELKALLGELLERRRVHARISEQDGFGREQLLHTEGAGSGVLVFVVPGLGGNVRLYFRAPDGERFLLRSVLLRAGFDDVGRELVGQVVETAVSSLLDSGDGLTREQAQLALTNEEAASRTTQPEAAAKPASQSPRAASEHAARPLAGGTTTKLEGWLAVR